MTKRRIEQAGIRERKWQLKSPIQLPIKLIYNYNLSIFCALNTIWDIVEISDCLNWSPFMDNFCTLRLRFENTIIAKN